MDIKYNLCNGKCPVFSWTMFYVLLSHGNAVLPNWTLKGSLCSNCTTPLWVGFITPRCYICQFDQNIFWYVMRLSFCYKLRSRGCLTAVFAFRPLSNSYLCRLYWAFHFFVPLVKHSPFKAVK